jgi:hypothetical protein
VPITLTNVSGINISAVGIDINYDTNVLDNCTCTTGSAGSAAGKSASCSTPSAGICRIAVAGLNNNVIGNGIVAYSNFPVKTTAPPGITPLTDIPSASDPGGNPVTVCGSNGSINVVMKPGDCNGDNSCSIAEVQSAINMYLGLKAVEACVDVNNGGTVTIDEVQKVINCYLGI